MNRGHLLITQYEILDMIAEAGIVNIQAQTMSPAIPHRTALSRLSEPIPTIDPVIV